ncbi:MAG: RbsD/FucU family protein [Bacteroidota bacterium]
MLKTKLLHPDILQVLAVNGHGARILIADGNFPFTTKTPPSSKKVFLNLAPGLVTVTDVLGVLKDYIQVESVLIMASPDENEQPVHSEFLTILGEGTELKKLKRQEFYEQVLVNDTCLVIATGETRRFANILLTIGVIKAS